MPSLDIYLARTYKKLGVHSRTTLAKRLAAGRQRDRGK
jgi:DNA-binding NarL/FixJ family response regulator